MNSRVVDKKYFCEQIVSRRVPIVSREMNVKNFSERMIYFYCIYLYDTDFTKGENSNGRNGNSLSAG